MLKTSIKYIRPGHFTGLVGRPPCGFLLQAAEEGFRDRVRALRSMNRLDHRHQLTQFEYGVCQESHPFCCKI